MADEYVYMEKATWTGICDNIRTKAGTTSTMTASEAETAISGISTGSAEDRLNDRIAGTLSGSITYDGEKVNDYALYMCGEVTSFSGQNVTYVGDSAFLGCNALTDVNLPAMTECGVSAFQACGFVSVNFPKLKDVQSEAFQYCRSMTSVCLPAVVRFIRGYEFEDCRQFDNSAGLTTVDLPSLTSFGASGTFYGCNCLKSLILRSNTVCTLSVTPENLCEGYGSTNPVLTGTGGYVYVPASLVDSYKTATNWSVISDKFRALESYTVDGTTTGALDSSKI